jgi:hypothetical protein
MKRDRLSFERREKGPQQLLLFAIPGDKILEGRAKAAAKGQAPIAQPGAMFCEMKGSCTLWETAKDLAISERQVTALLESGQIESFYVNDADRALRRHRRVLSSSVVSFINKRRSS